jgi:hypothetical protein
MAHDAKNTGGNKLEPLFYDTKQIAQLTGMSEFFFEKARSTGKPPIPYIPMGRAIRYDLEAVRRFFVGRTQHSTSEDRGARTYARIADEEDSTSATASVTMPPHRKRGRPRKALPTGSVAPGAALSDAPSPRRGKVGR